MARDLSDVARRVRPAVFAELQAHIDRKAARGEDLLPLHIGDTHVAPPAAARAVLDELDPNDATLHRYGATDGLSALRAAAAATLAARGLDVDPATEVLVGNGGTHALFCASRTVLDPGDEVLVAAPYWPLAPGVFGASGAVSVEVPLTQRLYADPTLDPAAIFAAHVTPRTKALYVISPNNPDGKVLSPSALERIAAFACEHDLWVFADEVYADIVFEGAPPRSLAAYPGMRERTIVLQSLSKSHALAGLRVGFCAAPREVIAAARRVSTHTAFNVSVAMQRAGEAALRDAAFSTARAAEYRAARDAVAAALAGAPLRFFLPEGATYLFLDFAPALAARPSERGVLPILERAIERGVLLAPGSAFGADFASFGRLCFTAVPEARAVLGATRLVAAIDDYLTR